MGQIVANDRPTPRPSNAFMRGASLLKDASRLRAIASVAVRHGFGGVLERLNLQDNAIVSILSRREDSASTALTMPERARLALQELGPTFVKLGQILSTRPDVVPAEYIAELRKLQDDVSTVPFESMREVIEEAMERPVQEVFADFEEKPVAAASVAQVYRARLFDGQEVAVKVLRPGVRELVHADVGVMQLLARRLESNFAEARALNLEAMVHEFERAMKRELDLRNEARNLSRFQRMFDGRLDVRVPKVFGEWSNRDMLVMEFVKGEKLTDAAEKLDDEQRDELVRTCFDVLFTMILREGLFHGDLHPGNVMLASDGSIVVYDLGLVGRLTPLMRERVVDLLIALSQNDAQAVSEAFYEMAIRTGPVDLRAFALEVAELLDGSFSERTLSELDLGRIMGQIGELGVRFGMRVPAEYAMMIKAVLTLEGVGKALAPDVDPMDVARPYVAEVMRNRFSPDRLGTEAVRTLLSLSRVARELPPTLREMVSSVEGGRVRFGVDLENLQATGPTLKRVVAPLTDALLVGGLSVAGAIALPHGESLLLGLPATSVVLFTMALVFLGRAVLNSRKS